MRAGLVGDHVRAHAAAPQFGQAISGVAAQRDGNGATFLRVLGNARQRVVQVVGLLVHVAGAQAEIDTGLLAFDVQRRSACQRGGQRLRAAHAAQAGGQHPATREVTAVVLAAGFDEGFIRALHDALTADVDPAAGGHLAVHGKTLGVQFVEVFPRGPVRYQVRVGDQHARGVGMGLEHADRLARLHQQGLQSQLRAARPMPP
ncbi:hypothetical protein G6F31_017924 [Rhizopus arrhizus]|nr:hypothetical protein G6F31_017924 [Rhizopus arrhizus]